MRYPPPQDVEVAPARDKWLKSEDQLQPRVFKKRLKGGEVISPAHLESQSVAGTALEVLPRVDEHMH